MAKLCLIYGKGLVYGFALIVLGRMGRALLVVTRVGRGCDGADWAIVGNFVSKIMNGSNFCAKDIAVISWWAIMIGSGYL